MSTSYNKDYIISQLNNGVSLDSIAAELTKMLNEAKSEYQEKNIKLTGANMIASDMNKFIQRYYPDLLNTDEVITGENIIELFDSIVELSKSMEDLRSLVQEPVKSGSNTTISSASYSDDATKIIEEFLKKYNIQ